MVGEKPREIAAEVLCARQSGEYVETLLNSTLARTALPPRDRAFLQELVYGAVRWELTLDWLIAEKSGKPQKSLVQNLLRLALYQMFWLDAVPSYAAVNESVAICKQRGLPAQARFINAVLRAYGRESEATRKRLAEFRATDLALGFSHPNWLVQRWVERFGKAHTLKLLEWNNTPAPAYARVNTLKTDAQTLQQRWVAESVGFEPTEFDWTPPGTVFLLRKHPPLGSLESFRAGLFYIQDPSTLLAIQSLDPRPGELILDLCAAPGGKTTFIAQKLRDEGRVVAQDLDSSRLGMVLENARRLGAKCIQTEPAADGYDRVLVDAPCSNTGVMRRRIELRWRIQPREIVRLAQGQRKLLNDAAAKTRPGGVLVYSTCSLEQEENEEVVRAFLAAHPEFTLRNERALTPFNNGVDGAYCAQLKKEGSNAG